MSEIQPDWEIPEDPELLLTVERVLAVGCGKPVTHGKRGRLQISMNCSRLRRCQECQERIANLDKVQLLNIIAELSDRNARLLELIKASNSHLQT